MSDEVEHKARIWMWCAGLLLLYVASYAPVDVWSHRHNSGYASLASPPPDPFAAPPPPPGWIEIAYAPAKHVYEWKPICAAMYGYYLWWNDRL